jgi:AcrR family transcriptional regulator
MGSQTAVRPPQQKRSQFKLERILEAAHEVVADVGFDAAAITEITKRAGVAVGTFYTRFENKEALLHALHEATTEANRERIANDLTEEQWANRSVRDILKAVIGGSVELARSIAGFQRACYQRALGDSAFAERELAVRTELRERLQALLLSHRDEIGHPVPVRAIDFCMELYVAIITEHVNAEKFSASRLSDEELITELVDACCAYLRLVDSV